jgi:phosphoserine phosphatase
MRYRDILFDVDSTLVSIEGLDWIAKMKGKEKEVAQLTARAMNGGLPMREAMRVKMDILRPGYLDLMKMGDAYIANIVPGARETVQILQQAGHEVWILTGNFQPAVGVLAVFLCIPASQVITNEIWFDDNGEYGGFDLDNLLSNNHGKAKVIQSYGDKLQRAVMIGDGSTDLDTKPVVDLFIGYGGVARRQKIEEGSEVYVAEPDLRAVLPHILDKTATR